MGHCTLSEKGIPVLHLVDATTDPYATWGGLLQAIVKGLSTGSAGTPAA